MFVGHFPTHRFTLAHCVENALGFYGHFDCFRDASPNTSRLLYETSSALRRSSFLNRSNRDRILSGETVSQSHWNAELDCASSSQNQNSTVSVIEKSFRQLTRSTVSNSRNFQTMAPYFLHQNQADLRKNLPRAIGDAEQNPSSRMR